MTDRTDRTDLLGVMDRYGMAVRSVDETRADLRAAAESMALRRPQLERPFAHEDEALLKYELAVRKGPYARCSGCGWLPHYFVELGQRGVNETQRCPSCGDVGKISRWKRWAPALISTSDRAWDWARRTAETLGLRLPEPQEGGSNG
jgi:hypothetical protein